MSRTDLLPSAIVRHREIKARLLERYDALRDDPEALEDTAEGESTLPDLLKRIVWEIRKVARDRAAIKERQLDLLDRDRALNERAGRLRALVAHGMAEGGITKIEDVEFSVGISEAKPKLVVTDDSLIPGHYVHIRTESFINKDFVRDALMAGETVPGAHLSNGGQTLTIRPKRARKEAAE